MIKIKKHKFWVNFIIWFAVFTISNAIGDYFGLKREVFSLDSVFRIGILIINFVIIELLVSKIIYVWNEKKL
jgi:hypothetical protein